MKLNTYYLTKTFNYFNYNLKNLFYPHLELESRIQKITSDVFTFQNVSDLEQAFKIAKSWSLSANNMKTFLSKTLSSANILSLIQNTNNPEETVELLKEAIQFLNDNYLLNISELKTATIAAERFKSRALIKEFALASVVEKEIRSLVKEGLYELKYFFYQLLDILSAIILSGGQGKSRRRGGSSSDETMNEWTAHQQLNTYFKLLALPATVFAFLSTYLEFQLLAIGLTALIILGTLSAITIYQRYLVPCPREYAGLKNLSLEILKNKTPIYLRLDVLSQIEKAFAEKKGVLLIGEPGSGKSSIAPALAKRISEGKIPFLPNATPVFFSYAYQYKSSYSEPSLISISNRFEKYKENVVFFFDEFHAFFVNHSHFEGNQSDSIKGFLNDYKFVIGTTTTEEYKNHIKGTPALEGRRFKKIKMSKLDEKKIQIILSQFLQTLYPEIILDENVLLYIVQKASSFNSQTSQIDAAQSLLNHAITKMKTINFEDLQDTISNLEDEAMLLNQKLVDCCVEQNKELLILLEKQNKKIANVKGELEKKIQKIESIKKIEAYCLKLKHQSFQMADLNINLLEDTSLMRKWLELNAAIKLMNQLIAKERNALGLPYRLNVDLIDSIIQQSSRKQKTETTTC